MDKLPTRACRVCGCTETRACPERCHWVEADLCSQCDPATREEFARRRFLMVSALRSAGFAMASMAEIAEDPRYLGLKTSVDAEAVYDNAMDGLVVALRLLIEATGDLPATAKLMAALAAFYEGDTFPDTDAEDAAGVRAGSPQPAANEGTPMLSITAKTNICTILEALVHGGGVRSEDFGAVTEALDGIKTEFAADEANIADLETRVSALEDLANGEEKALVDPAGDTVGTSTGAAGADALTTTTAGVDTAVGTAGTDAVTTSAAAVDSAVSQTGVDEVTTASIAPQAL